MTLTQLQYFKTLAHVLHYTRAAEELHIAQPSLSYSINELEKELGVNLFAKEDRHIILTTYGKQFLPYVENALATLDEGSSLLRHMADCSSREVRLGYFHSIASTFVPSVMDNLYRNPSNANLRFQFTEGTTKEILELLKNGKLDFAFCMYDDDWLDAVPVMFQQLYLAIPQGHRLSGSKSVQLNDIGDDAFILLNQNSSLGVLVEKLFAKYALSPNVPFVVQECNAALQYVSLGFGVSILPWVPAMESGKVEVIPLVDGNDDLYRTVFFSWIKNRPLSPDAKLVRDYIVENYAVS